MGSGTLGSTPVELRIGSQSLLGTEIQIRTLLPNMLIIIEDLLLLWELILLNILLTARRIGYVFIANVVIGPVLFDLVLVMLN